jgi:hypothetical protein
MTGLDRGSVEVKRTVPFKGTLVGIRLMNPEAISIWKLGFPVASGAKNSKLGELKRMGAKAGMRLCQKV